MPRTGFELGALFACRYTGDAGDQEHCDGFLLNSYAQDRLRAWSIVRLSLHRRRRRPGALRWFSPELLCPGSASSLEHGSLVITQETQETRSNAMVFSSLLCPGPASSLEHCSLVVTQETQE